MINILIVEDSKVVIRKMSLTLKKLGFKNLVFATNGKDAIEIVIQKSIDLVIMDIVLEGKLDGVETSKKINKYKTIPIIYLTQDIKNYRRLPAGSVYLNKPFTENELKHNIEIILEQHSLKKKLNEKIHWFSALFNYSTEAIIMFDKDFKIQQVNKKYKEIFNYNENNIIDIDLKDIVNSHLSFLTLEKKFLVNKSLEIERELVFDTEESRHFLIKGIPIYKDREFIGGYLTYIDISELKRKQKKIEYISQHDVMTGLFNRRAFEKKLSTIFNNSKIKVGLIIGDINKLKKINDTYGHSLGDKYIRLASRVLRESLPSDAIIARIGGDEFGILLKNTDEKMCKYYCEVIKEKSLKYSLKKNLNMDLSIALGFSIQNQRIVDTKELFHNADQKMYKQKNQTDTLLSKEKA